MKMFPVIAALACTLVLAPAQAAEKDHEARHTITVHIGGHLGNGLAKDANEMHAKMEAEGWRFVSLAVHTENGDTEGLWVTYVRD